MLNFLLVGQYCVLTPYVWRKLEKRTWFVTINNLSTSIITTYDNCSNYRQYHRPPSLSSRSVYMNKSHKTSLTNQCNRPHLVSRHRAWFNISDEIVAGHLNDQFRVSLTTPTLVLLAFTYNCTDEDDWWMPRLHARFLFIIHYLWWTIHLRRGSCPFSMATFWTIRGHWCSCQFFFSITWILVLRSK